MKISTTIKIVLVMLLPVIASVSCVGFIKVHEFRANHVVPKFSSAMYCKIATKVKSPV